MRSLFGRFIPGTPATFGVLLSGLTLYSGVALAEEPIAPSEVSSQPSVVTQSTTTTVTTAAPPAALPPPPVMAAPPVYAAPPAPVYAAPPAPMPYPAYPMAAPPVQPMPPSSGSFQGPVYFNGPVWIIPAPTNGQPVAPPLPPPPVYTQPPQAYAPPPAPVYTPPRYAPMRRAMLFPNRRYTAPAYKRGPVVGMGARFSMLGISSQKVFGQDLNLYGGGIFMRFRSQGRFGFEMALDAMRSNIKDDAFLRTSYPFTVAPMLYLFQNRPENHFNIYAVAGFGLMADDVTLYKGTSRELKQQFWEVLGQAGGGVEVRFSKLALFADVRAIGMLLDDSSPAGIFYQNVDGGPIPASSAGYKVNAGAILWF